MDDEDDEGTPGDTTNDQVSEYVYDKMGHVVTFQALYGSTDGSSQDTVYAYDMFNRLTQTTFADSSAVTLTYDKGDNVVTKIDPAASTAVYSYDNRNHMTLVNVTKGTTARGVDKESFTYDALGRLTYAYNMEGTNTNAKVNLAYTTNGMPDSERLQIYYSGTAGTDKTTAYFYDGNGRRTKIEYPDHSATSDDYVTLSRDYAGRITKVQKKDGSESVRTVVEYVYQGTERVLTKKHYSDEATQALSLYAYDGENRLTGITHQFDTNPVTKIAVFEYGYDFRDRREYEDRFFYDRDGNRVTTIGDGDLGDYYEYDLLGRLTKVYRGLQDGWTYPLSGGEYNTLATYSYDKVGNRTARVVGGTTTTYAYNTVNEMTLVDSTTHGYDPNGNHHYTGSGMAGVTCCHYDYKNRAANIIVGQYTRKYYYDPLGRRIQKIEPGFTGTTTTRYFYAGLNVINYADGSDSTQKQFVHGLGLDDVVEYEDANGNRYAYHENALRSTGALTDRANQQQDEQARYTEFGETSFVQIDGTGASSVSASQIENDFLYTARQFDDEPGMAERYHFRAREYDPKWGRFRQRDPLVFKEGPDPYAYVRQSPTNFRDPLGLLGEDDCKAPVFSITQADIDEGTHFLVVSPDRLAQVAIALVRTMKLKGRAKELMRHCLWGCLLSLDVGEALAKSEQTWFEVLTVSLTIPFTDARADTIDDSRGDLEHNEMGYDCARTYGLPKLRLAPGSDPNWPSTWRLEKIPDSYFSTPSDPNVIPPESAGMKNLKPTSAIDHCYCCCKKHISSTPSGPTTPGSGTGPTTTSPHIDGPTTGGEK